MPSDEPIPPTSAPRPVGRDWASLSHCARQTCLCTWSVIMHAAWVEDEAREVGKVTPKYESERIVSRCENQRTAGCECIQRPIDRFSQPKELLAGSQVGLEVARPAPGSGLLSGSWDQTRPREEMAQREDGKQREIGPEERQRYNGNGSRGLPLALDGPNL